MHSSYFVKFVIVVTLLLFYIFIYLYIGLRPLRFSLGFSATMRKRWIVWAVIGLGTLATLIAPVLIDSKCALRDDIFIGLNSVAVGTHYSMGIVSGIPSPRASERVGIPRCRTGGSFVSALINGRNNFRISHACTLH